MISMLHNMSPETIIGVSMVVADDLAPIWRQAICNHHTDLKRSIYGQMIPRLQRTVLQANRLHNRSICRPQNVPAHLLFVLLLLIAVRDSECSRLVKRNILQTKSPNTCNRSDIFIRNIHHVFSWLLCCDAIISISFTCCFMVNAVKL